MASAARHVLLVALVACKRDTAPAVDEAPEVSGTLTVGDRPTKLTECHPTAGPDGVAVVLTTDTGGRLRFRRGELAFQLRDPRWEVLPCDKLERSWGGGARADGSAYFRGTLDFACRWGNLAMAGKLALDCGHITAAERASLDKNRLETLGEPPK